MTANTDMDPNASPLRLKNKHNPDIVPEAERKKQHLSKASQKKKPAKSSRKFGMRFFGMSIGSFLVASALFGTFIYHQISGLDLLTLHQLELTRGIVVVSWFVILVIDAFTQDMLQGILALFMPPYAFIYGLLFADAGPVRGVTMALLCFFAAEIYFTPDNALVPETLSTLNGWIESGQQKLINPDKKDAGFEN
ncbi:hypothetical protein P3T73_01830 [Kiritimatiellota bacterium B12222]|nr:hypothetical protein P3T73_01830 [Kiritimatiellota bacterium B12222]